MKTLITAAAVAVSLVATPCFAAAVTIGQFAQLGQPDSFRFKNNNNGTATLTSIGTGQFDFDFWPANLPAALASQNAFFSMIATANTPAATSGPIIEQEVASGTIAFTRVTPFNGLTNLLTIQFTNAQLWGPGGGRGLNLIGSDAAGTVTYTSDFLDFTNTIGQDYSIALTGLSVPLQIGNGGLLKSFTADITGTLSVQAVPEPATWAMMIIGFAGVGGALRQRRRATALAA